MYFALRRVLRRAGRNPFQWLLGAAWWLLRTAAVCFAALGPAPPPPPPPPPPQPCQQAEGAQPVKRR